MRPHFSDSVFVEEPSKLDYLQVNLLCAVSRAEQVGCCPLLSTSRCANFSHSAEVTQRHSDTECDNIKESLLLVEDKTFSKTRTSRYVFMAHLIDVHNHMFCGRLSPQSADGLTADTFTSYRCFLFCSATEGRWCFFIGGQLR